MQDLFEYAEGLQTAMHAENAHTAFVNVPLIPLVQAAPLIPIVQAAPLDDGVVNAALILGGAKVVQVAGAGAAGAAGAGAAGAAGAGAAGAAGAGAVGLVGVPWDEDCGNTTESDDWVIDEWSDRSDHE